MAAEKVDRLKRLEERKKKLDKQFELEQARQEYIKKRDALKKK